MSLAHLQRAFISHVVAGDETIVPLVTPDQRRGLPVYSYAYRATLRGALRDTFEKTLLWLGEDAFETVADEYIATCPSRSWTLSNYGDGFAEFLASRRPGDPEFAELAWLDWSLRRAFSAGTLPPTEPAALAAVDWETTRLALAPHLAFRTIETNVIEVWNGLPDAPVATSRLAAPIGLVVWRKDLSPEFRSAACREVEALALLAAGKSFAAICAAVAGDSDDAVAAVGSMLSIWLRDGLAAPLV